jgi:PKD repeat protein
MKVEWQGINSDPYLNTPDYQVEINISYMFDGNTVPFGEYPSGYEFTGTMEKPVGSSVSIASSDFDAGLIKLQKRVDHTVAGQYSITGTLVNTFCHPNSPYREVTIASTNNNNSFYFDAHPFAVAGNDITETLVGGEANVTFDASDSWDDGTISKYEWDWDGDGSFDESTTAPVTTHTYTTTGTYFVTLRVTDNTGKLSVKQSGISNTMTVTIN